MVVSHASSQNHLWLPTKKEINKFHPKLVWMCIYLNKIQYLRIKEMLSSLILTHSN